MLWQADLHGAKLSHADLHGAFLYKADLHGAYLREADLHGAYLSEADLHGAGLRYTDLQDARLWQADLHGADLNEADLHGAYLTSANLLDADISNIQYDSPEPRTPHPLSWLKKKYSDEQKVKSWVIKLVDKLSPIGGFFERFFKRLKLWTYVPDHYQGIRIETAYGDSLFKRFAQDRDYIETYKRKYPRAGWWWWFLTDYGQSWRLMIFWFVLVSLFFGGLFAVLPDGWFQYGPSFIDSAAVSPSWFTPWYFSIVTLTTLGFGDLVPTNWIAQMIVVAEVILGYVLLGLLISVLANKVARRS